MNNIIVVGTYGKESTNSMSPFLDNVNLLHRFKNRRNNRTFFRLNGEKTKNVDLTSNKIVRWGNSIPLNLENSIVYNTATANALASNKYKSRRLMLKEGISCPVLISNVSNTFPVIARPHKHTKGQDFIILNNQEELTNHYDINNWYYSEFIDKTQEFRVHCTHGKVLRLLEKPNPNNGNVMWNFDANEDMSFKIIKWSDAKPYKNVITEALKAMDVVGLDFGAVDVILKDGKAYVLEINTSPNLAGSENTCKRWARYFNWLFRTDEKREHFNYKEYTDVKSYFFKNFQLDE